MSALESDLTGASIFSGQTFSTVVSPGRNHLACRRVGRAGPGPQGEKQLESEPGPDPPPARALDSDHGPQGSPAARGFSRQRPGWVVFTAQPLMGPGRGGGTMLWDSEIGISSCWAWPGGGPPPRPGRAGRASGGGWGGTILLHSIPGPAGQHSHWQNDSSRPPVSNPKTLHPKP